ncbi:MAG: phosphoribosylaminoimidazolesuccinocarboxamide synthase [Myxococcales bacterium]|nr:MAG: phosphoribosylaminoimidazolesuccinocarboxamide synthase [Myxococcales bacterium]
MGAQLPKKLAEADFDRTLAKSGLTRVHQGKVRDTYLSPRHPELMLLVATDRLSIFDFVLPALVPQKGEVLTALTVFWLADVLKDAAHHLEAYGAGLDAFLPSALCGLPDLQTRGMIVRRLAMIPVECVVRGYLTGSGWSAYQRAVEVCGHRLPTGLHDGSRLPEPIFTPTTKAEVGHDEHVSYVDVRARFGRGLEEASLSIYRQIHDYAAGRGIILADTKFEFGEGLVLGDEVATPDSSRFWDKGEWEEAAQRQKSPSGYDKQPVREWGKTVATPFSAAGQAIMGIDKLDTEEAAQRDFVHGLNVPADVTRATADRYLSIFERLTGQTLAAFQAARMDVKR